MQHELVKDGVIIYGAGSQSEQIINEAKRNGASVLYFVAADAGQGETKLGVDILQPEDGRLRALTDKPVFLANIGSKQQKAVIQRLHSLGFTEIASKSWERKKYYPKYKEEFSKELAMGGGGGIGQD